MFRFTIRDVLLATAIVALAVGWWLDRANLASNLKSVSNRLAVLEAVVGAEGLAITFDQQGDSISHISVSKK